MPNAKKSRVRHLAKAVRGALSPRNDVLVGLFFFQDDAKAVQKATSVAVAESVLKMALYYFHERRGTDTENWVVRDSPRTLRKL